MRKLHDRDQTEIAANQGNKKESTKLQKRLSSRACNVSTSQVAKGAVENGTQGMQAGSTTS